MSAHPVPSISTLSQVLAAAAPIDPGLLAEDGMAPPLPSNHAHRSSSGYSSFERSAARDDDSRWDGYAEQPSSSSQAIQAWDQEYRVTHVPSGTPSPPRKKRARQSKGRQGNNVTELEIFDATQELEYTHASQDPKMGPIFVHPQPNAAQACVRCHRIKRKCDNARPRCAGCEKSDVPCVFELSAATSTFVHQLKAEASTLQAQISAAHERIAELEAILSQREAEPSSNSWQPRDALQFSSASRASSPRNTATSTHEDFMMLAQSVLAPALTMLGQESDHSLPDYEAAKAAANTFFDRRSVWCLFLDRSQLLRDLDQLYLSAQRENGLSQPDRSGEAMLPQRPIVLMVIAIGILLGKGLGIASKERSKASKAQALAGLSAIVGRQYMYSVQFLILMSVYLMYDPSDTPLWQALGIAMRMAIDIGLHRSPDNKMDDDEQRRRTFWSLYSLDRYVSGVLGRPVTLGDTEIDVELPSSLPDDEHYDGVPTSTLLKHVVKLRQLSGKIFLALPTTSGPRVSSKEVSGEVIAVDLRAKLDQWLAECPLSAVESKVDAVNGNTWFSLAYHEALVALYRRSLWPNPSTDQLLALYQACSKCVEHYHTIWRKTRVAYNAINVSAQLLAAFTLVYCLCELDGREQDGEWTQGAADQAGRCLEIFKIFGGIVPGLAEYTAIFERSAASLVSKYKANDAATSSNGVSKTTDSRDSTRRKHSTIAAAESQPKNQSPVMPPGIGSSRAEAWQAMLQLGRSGIHLKVDVVALEDLPNRATTVTGDKEAVGDQSLLEMLF